MNPAVFRNQPPETRDELAGRNISARCPHCGDKVRLIPYGQPLTPFTDLTYFVATCPNEARSACKPIFAVYQSLNDMIFDIYPIASFEADWLDKAIPEPIRKDMAEAFRCRFVKSYKGAVTMFRRVVEAVACDKLGVRAKDKRGKTKKLYVLIDLMLSEGLITKDLRDSAHEVRYFGNYGAHLQDDGLDNVTDAEAEHVGRVTQDLLYNFYSAPDAAQRLRDKRNKAKGSLGGPSGSTP